MSDFEKMSRADEQRVMAALERAVSLTNSGTPPSEAICKVATDEHFTPAVVRRMVEAYNVSKTLAHMKHASGPERAASFPLAQADEVLAKMYPKHVVSPAEKAAAEYRPGMSGEKVNHMRPAAPGLPWEKRAEAYPQDPNILAGKALGRLSGFKKAAERARAEYRGTFDRLTYCLKDASNCFRMLRHEPFASVEKKAVAEYGVVGRSLMDTVYEMAGLKEKRADEFPAHAIFDAGREPYRQLAEAVKLAHELQDRAAESAAKEAAYDACRREVAPEKEEPVLLGDLLGGSNLPFAHEKAAGGVFFSPTQALETLAGDPESAQAEAQAAVFDPEHEAQLQGVKTQAMLNDFISNDPILSSYDPEEVMSAYNQISQLTPSLAQQPAMMRGLLRRVIQQGGVLEPHEAHQIAEVEKQVRMPMATGKR